MNRGTGGEPPTSPSIRTLRVGEEYIYVVIFFNTIFLSSHMSPENPKGTQVIVGSMNMGYDIYPTLPGIELITCSVDLTRLQ